MLGGTAVSHALSHTIIYQKLLVNFKGESFDFLAFSEELAVVQIQKKKLCTYVRTDISSHRDAKKTTRTNL